MNSPLSAPFARMPWYPRDFRSSTLGWPLAARAAYRELLDAQWDHGGSGIGTLPDDEEALRLIAGATPAEWRAAWKYIAPKFQQVDGGRRNERLEVHRRVALDEFINRRKGANATNAKRWGYHSNGNGQSLGESQTISRASRE